MVKITENSDEFIIRYIPVSQWIIGFLLIFVFIFFIFWLFFLYFFSPNDFFGTEPKSWIAISPFIAASAGLVIMNFFELNPIKMIRTPLTALKINQKLNYLEIIHQRFYGHETKRFYFSQIEKLKSYQKNKRKFLALVLANQTEIRPKIQIGKEIKPATLVRKLNKLIKTSKVKDFSK